MVKLTERQISVIQDFLDVCESKKFKIDLQDIEKLSESNTVTTGSFLLPLKIMFLNDYCHSYIKHETQYVYKNLTLILYLYKLSEKEGQHCENKIDKILTQWHERVFKFLA